MNRAIGLSFFPIDDALDWWNPQRPYASPLVHDRRDEEMVQAVRRRTEHLSEIPCRVSSDLHEWRNDLGAVSSASSVKLEYR